MLFRRHSKTFMILEVTGGGGGGGGGCPEQASESAIPCIVLALKFGATKV